MRKLTLGYRARIKPDTSWDEYNGREVLLVEKSNGDFSVMVLREGKDVALAKDADCPVVNEIAWLSESEMEFVDSDLEANFDFIDWYQDNEDSFCPHCLAYCAEVVETHAFKCPKCGCEWG